MRFSHTLPKASGCFLFEVARFIGRSLGNRMNAVTTNENALKLHLVNHSRPCHDSKRLPSIGTNRVAA